MTCSHCGNAAHLDFTDGSERCTPCRRTAAWCKCAPVEARREPLWLERSRAKPHGLARDLTAVA